MGINNLLNFVSESCNRDNIAKFRNRTFAVDMYCFLYKSIYHENSLKHLNLYLDIVLKYASHVYLVFDGKPPDSKTWVREKRNIDSEKYLRKSVTNEFIQEVVEYFKRIRKISIIFAPSESDSQLAYLNLKGLADIILTEDSDLIVHGCQIVIFKLKPRGNCIVYRKEKLNIPWHFDIFRWICILCGCDYLKGGIKGLGFKKARKLFDAERFTECMMIEEFADFLKSQFEVSDVFLEKFFKAEESFTKQTVIEM